MNMKHVGFFLLLVLPWTLLSGQKTKPAADANSVPELENRLRSVNPAGPEKLDLLTRLAEALQDNEPKRAVVFGKEGLELLSQQENEDKEQKFRLRLLLALTIGLKNLGEHESALSYSREGEQLAQRVSDKHALALFHNECSRLFSLLGYIKKSAKRAIQAVTLFEQLGDRRNLAEGYKNIGNIYLDMKNSQMALEHYLKARQLMQDMGDNRGVGKMLNNIGNMYSESGQKDKALDYYRQSLLIMEKEKWDIGQVVELVNIAGIISDKGDDKSSYQYNLRAMEISKRIGNKRLIAVLLSNMGVNLRKMGRHKEALRLVYQALDIAKEIKNKDIVRNFHEELSYIYDAMKDYKNAFLYLKKYKKNNDEIFSADAQKGIAEALLKYNTAVKEKEIQQLTRDNRVKQLKLEQQTLIRYFFMAVTLLVLILALVLFNRYRIKRKAEIQLKEINASKDKLFSIIAHDLGSPLNSLLLSTAFLEEKFANMSTGEVKDFLHQINDNAAFMSNLLDNLLHWSVSQLGKMEFSPEAMDMFDTARDTLRLMEPTAREKQIDMVSHIQPGTGVYADKRMVDAVMRNLVSNAVKFSNDGGKVEISCTANGQFLEIEVKDNGVGIPPDTQDSLFKLSHTSAARGTAGERGTGLGLVLCKELVEKHGGQIQLDSIANGTRAAFTLPLPNGEMS